MTEPKHFLLKTVATSRITLPQQDEYDIESVPDTNKQHII